MLNFETLEHLDLSCNWFGMPGLGRFKQQFRNFKQLKVLNLSNNKLCNDEGHDTREFRDVLLAVKDQLEELYISENQIKDPDMLDFLLEPLCQMPKLRVLVMARNTLTRLGSVGLLAQMVTYKQ